MAKYEVEVGGFVTVFRHRKLIVHADTWPEASEKALEKFVEIQQKDGSSMCSGGQVESVKRLGD